MLLSFFSAAIPLNGQVRPALPFQLWNSFLSFWKNAILWHSYPTVRDDPRLVLCLADFCPGSYSWSCFLPSVRGSLGPGRDPFRARVRPKYLIFPFSSSLCPAFLSLQGHCLPLRFSLSSCLVSLNSNLSAIGSLRSTPPSGCFFFFFVGLLVFVLCFFFFFFFFCFFGSYRLVQPMFIL